MSDSIFNGQSMVLKIACSNPRILLEKANLVLLIKAPITQKKINLPNLSFGNYVRAGTKSSL